MQHLSKTLRGLALLATTLLTLTACNDDELVPGGENGGSFPGHLTTHTIRITAGHDDSNSTRTTLQPNGQVTWDKGDCFRMLNEKDDNEVSTTIQITLNEKEQAIGIPLSGASIDGPNIKYEGINVLLNGQDITNKIVNNNTNDNEFLFGALNVKGSVFNRVEYYRYATPGTVMDLRQKGSGSNMSAPIAESSDRSNISNTNVAIITIRGIQWNHYLNTGSQWKALNSKSKLNNGSKWGKKDVTYRWLSSMDYKMDITKGENTSVGEFEGSSVSENVVTEKTRAVYPYASVQNYKDGNLTINIPAEQTYAPNTFDHQANIMVGRVEKKSEGGYHVPFKNMMGVLKLSLTGNNDFIQSITITDKAGKPLWGTASIKAEEYENGISVDNITGGNPSITLKCDGVKLTDTATDFYFVVPVGAFSAGFTMELETADRRKPTIGTSMQNTIQLNDIKVMPALKIPETKLYEHHLQNIAVNKYMSITPGPVFGSRTLMTLNEITSNKTAYYDQDRPEYFHISWTGENTSTYLVTLKDDTKNTNVYTDRQVNGTEYDLINMVPEHQYSYLVKSADGKEITGGKFLAVDQIREVTIEDSWNYRDLGGWTGLDGRKIKYEWIYRGGSLNGVYTKGTNQAAASIIGDPGNYEFTEKGKQQIQDLGIKAELDLRNTKTESTGKDYSHALSFGFENIHFTNWTWDFTRIPTSNALNNPMTNDNIVDDIKWIIDEIMSGKPVAFHCKSGADRTGGVALTILSLLGVDPSDIARDYELTNFSREQGIVTGTREFRDRKANDTKKEIYKFYTTGFPSFGNDKGSNWQEKCYYYLNRKFRNGTEEEQKASISSKDLDAFIEFMLDMPAGTYQHPSWAVE